MPNLTFYALFLRRSILTGILVAWLSYDGVNSFPGGVCAGMASAQERPSVKSANERSDADGWKIGGQDVVQLTRRATRPTGTPEFLTATILPGRGMNLFQITAKLPGGRAANIFAAPSLAEAAPELNDGPDDSHGVKSFAFGGAFLVPYPNRIRGALSPDGREIVSRWRSKTLHLPAVWKGKKNPDAELHAIHGLILDRKTDNLSVVATPDGQTATGIIHAGNFDGHWLSDTDITISVALHSETVEATINVKNIGSEPEPIGIGWHPYFAIPSGNRKQARLRIPASELAEVNNYDDVFPTGKLIPVKGTKYDFTALGGKPLDDIFLDDNFSRLSRERGTLVVDLTDPAAKYGLHIDGISNEIKTVQVYAPPDKPFAAIEEQFNFADPFSDVWGGMDTGMVTLDPGHSVTWKVSLKLFTPRP